MLSPSGETAEEIALYITELTREERATVRAGSLINYKSEKHRPDHSRWGPPESPVNGESGIFIFDILHEGAGPGSLV